MRSRTRNVVLFCEIKTQPSLERALKRKEILGA